MTNSDLLPPEVLRRKSVVYVRQSTQLWQLPLRFRRISDANNAQHPSARTVDLAVRLARHTAHGWTDPAICADITDMASLLNLSEGATLLLLEDI